MIGHSHGIVEENMLRGYLDSKFQITESTNCCAFSLRKTLKGTLGGEDLLLEGR